MERACSAWLVASRSRFVHLQFSFAYSLLTAVLTSHTLSPFSYERLMVQMLQSTFDLQEKEDEFLGLVECIEKEKKGKTRERRKSGARSWWGGGGKGGEDATEMNSVVMQLSRKLEELLIDNEDLREQVKRAGGGGRSPAK